MYLLWIRGDYCLHWCVDENVTRGSQEPIFAFLLRPTIYLFIVSVLESETGFTESEKDEN